MDGSRRRDRVDDGNNNMNATGTAFRRSVVVVVVGVNGGGGDDGCGATTAPCAHTTVTIRKSAPKTVGNYGTTDL